MTDTRWPTTTTAGALLFDMDGTLVDSTPVVERTWRSFASRHGIDVARILAVSHGRRTEETVAEFVPAGVDVKAETRRLIAQEVADTEGVVAVPGAAELLASLPVGSWALVTSAGRALAEARMAAAGLPVPPVVVSADDVTTGKPSPQGYLIAADRLGVVPEQAVVFEDAEAGLLAARASGASTVVVGACDAPVTGGLTRVADLRDVRVEHAAGRLLLSYGASDGVVQATERQPEPGLLVGGSGSWLVRAQQEVRYEVRFRDALFRPDRTDLLEMGSDVSTGERLRRLVVVDSEVDLLHGDTIRAYFDHHDVEYSMVVIQANETDKQFSTAARIVEELDAFGIARRREPLIVIGGGVLLDIVGLAASLYRRGTPFLRVPTTLIGLVDAGVGAKTGVNFKGSKNRLGTYAPAEKIALIKDLALFQMLEEHGALLLDEKFQGLTPIGDEAAVAVLSAAIHGMLEELQPNLWEAELERCVDYGHTFSPTVEMRALPALLHGEAVCVDMALTTMLAYGRGLLSEEQRDRVLAVMSALELPSWDAVLDPEVLAHALEDTVRHRDGSQRLPLPVGIGGVTFVNDVTDTKIRAALALQRELHEQRNRQYAKTRP
jgi:3-dehydroquinate synthase